MEGHADVLPFLHVLKSIPISIKRSGRSLRDFYFPSFSCEKSAYKPRNGKLKKD